MASQHGGGDRRDPKSRGELAAGVRAAIPADTPAWLRMRCALWPESTVA